MINIIATSLIAVAVSWYVVAVLLPKLEEFWDEYYGDDVEEG